MTSTIDKALAAALREGRAAQRFDKAEADYRIAHREFCTALAALDAQQGRTSDFARFCAKYNEKAVAGEVKPRSVQVLREMRQAGLLNVTPQVVATVDPTKIVVAAKRAHSKKSPLTEEIAVNALAASNGETVHAFEAALDHYADQMTVLPKNEQVLPKTPKNSRKPKGPTKPAAVLDENSVLFVPIDPDDVFTEEDEVNNRIQNEVIKEQIGAILEQMDEGADWLEHPAERHLARAKSAVHKVKVYPAQRDRLKLLHMELGALLDGDDTVTDAAIQELLDAEGDGK